MGLLVRGHPKHSVPSFNRPYALTSRLHNNDAMLWGQDLSRCAHVLCWKSVGALSLSVRGPGPARRYGMQGLARWLHAWRWRTWQCLIWPPTRGGALLWCHMHKVYYIFFLALFRFPPLLSFFIFHHSVWRQVFIRLLWTSKCTCTVRICLTWNLYILKKSPLMMYN